MCGHRNSVFCGNLCVLREKDKETTIRTTIIKYLLRLKSVSLWILRKSYILCILDDLHVARMKKFHRRRRFRCDYFDGDDDFLVVMAQSHLDTPHRSRRLRNHRQ